MLIVDLCLQFKCDYFNMPLHLIPMSLVEKEYWRILDNIGTGPSTRKSKYFFILNLRPLERGGGGFINIVELYSIFKNP